MKAEEIVLSALAYNSGRVHMTMRDDARHIVNELRKAGLLSANPADDFDLAKLHEEAFGAGFQAACDFYKVGGVK